MKNEQTTASHAPCPSSNPGSPEPGKEPSIFDLLVPIIVSRRKAGDSYDTIRADLEAVGNPLDDVRWRQLVFVAALDLAFGGVKKQLPPNPRTQSDDHPGRSVICRIFEHAKVRPGEEKNTVIDISRVDGVWRTNVEK